MLGLFCNVFGGANDVVKHFSSKYHLQAIVTKSTSSQLSQFGFSESIVTKREKDKIKFTNKLRKQNPLCVICS